MAAEIGQCLLLNFLRFNHNSSTIQNLDYLDVVLAQEVGVVLGQTLLHPVGQRGAPGPHQRHAQVAWRGCSYI